MATITGTRHDNTINGVRGENNQIDGRGGNDILIGKNRSDTLRGGAGNDELYGDGGDDFLYGGSGNDYLSGGEGWDRLAGGDGDDRLIAHENDIVHGGAGDDEISGYAMGTSVVYGDKGDDYIDVGGSAATAYGGAGNDFLTTSERIDGFATLADARLYGDGGRDQIYAYLAEYADGGAGDDIINVVGEGVTVQGGAGNDRIRSNFISGLIGEGDTIHGGAGDEDAIFYGVQDGIVARYRVNIGEGRVDKLIYDDNGEESGWIDAGTDRISGIEIVITHNARDTLIGSSGSDDLRGLGNRDTLLGRKGDDALNGGLGRDHIDGGAGFDIASYSFAYDLGGDELEEVEEGGVVVDLSSGLVRGHMGRDTLVSIEGLQGSEFADVLRGTNAFNMIFAEEGDDKVVLRRGDDLALGGLGDDTIKGGGGDDFMQGEEGDDLLLGGKGDDLLSGDDGDDRLVGGAGADRFVFASRFGVDTIVDFEAGQDVILLVEGDLVVRTSRFLSAGRQTDQGVLFDFGDDQLLLEGVTLRSLDIDDVRFVTEADLPEQLL